ncbi:MAG: lysine--tRNA ligase, partial [Maribacter sp.]
LVMLMTNNASIQEVLFFPQMRPEKKPLQLSDNEKVIFEILKSAKKMELEVLKTKSELSNKAWDKGIKGITKQQLAKVYKVEDILFAEIAN